MHRFRNLIFGGIFFCSVTSANAALIVSESFLTGSNPAAGEYSLASINGQNASIAGTTGAWVQHCCGSATVESNGLVYSDPNYFPIAAGGKLVSGAGESDAMRNGRVLSTGYTNSSTGTVYLSLLMQLSNTDLPYRGFELHNGSFNDADRKFQMGSHSGDFPVPAKFGVRLFNDNSLRQSLGDTNTDVNLFVVKFTFSTVNNGDSLTVWQNPSLASGTDPSGGVTFSNFNLEFDRFAFGRFPNGSGSVAWDEFRIGDSWASVVPEPSSFALLVCGMVAVAVCGKRRT